MVRSQVERAKSIFVNKENSEQALGHLFIKSSSSHFFNKAISNTTSNYNPIFSLNLNPTFIEFGAKTSFFSTLPVKNLVERLSFLEYFCHWWHDISPWWQNSSGVK